MRMTRSWFLGLLVAVAALAASPRASQAAVCSDTGVVVALNYSCVTNGGLDTLTIGTISMPAGVSVFMTVGDFGGLYSVGFSFRNSTTGASITLSSTANGSSIAYSIAQTYAGLQQVALSVTGVNGFGSVKETLNPGNFQMIATPVLGIGPLDYNANHLLPFTVVDQISITIRTLTAITNDFYVPEPASLTLFGAGLAGLAWFRRRRRS